MLKSKTAAEALCKNTFNKFLHKYIDLFSSHSIITCCWMEKRKKIWFLVESVCAFVLLYHTEPRVKSCFLELDLINSKSQR